MWSNIYAILMYHQHNKPLQLEARGVKGDRYISGAGPPLWVVSYLKVLVVEEEIEDIPHSSVHT